MGNKAIIYLTLILTGLIAIQAHAAVNQPNPETGNKMETSLSIPGGGLSTLTRNPLVIESSAESMLLSLLVLAVIGFIFKDKLIANTRPETPSEDANKPTKTPPATQTRTATARKTQPATARPKVVNTPPNTTTIIKFSDDASQCQASTAKGTQCSRKANLTTIQRTINKQKCQFAVCNQHKNPEFKPYPPLIKDL